MDRAFVRDLDGEGAERARVRVVVALAHGIGLREVAEEVETGGRRRLPVGFGGDGMRRFLVKGTLPVEGEPARPAARRPRA